MMRHWWKDAVEGRGMMRHRWIDTVERRGMMGLRWIESRKRNNETYIWNREYKKEL